MRKESRNVLLGALVVLCLVAVAVMPMASNIPSKAEPKIQASSSVRSITLCDGPGCKVINPNGAALYPPMSDYRSQPEPMSTGSRAVNKYAVLAGVSDYPGSGMDLNYCDDDVYDTRDKLVALGWPQANIHLLIDSQATAANILSEIAWMKGQEDASSQTYFHYSGHGNSGYFLVYDTQMTDDTLANAFNGFESVQQVIVMDTCFAGSFTALNRANTIGLMACSNNEYSYDGMFTPALMSKLTDTSVSLESAFNAAKATVSSQTGGAQNPVMWDNIAGDLLLGDKPPVIGSVPNFNAPEDTPMIMTLTPYESDEEDSGVDLDWSVSNYDPAVIATMMGERSDNDTIILSPQLNYFGTTNIELTLQDSVGLKDKKLVTLTWTPVNDPPTVASMDRTKPTVLRTQTVTLKLFGNDLDDLPAQMTAEFELSLSGQAMWTAISGSSYKSGHWEADYTPASDTVVGAYDARARLKDKAGETSSWLTRTSVLEVKNNLPVVSGLSVPSLSVERTRDINVSIFGKDIEDAPADMVAELEIKAPGGDFHVVGSAQIVDDHWDVLVSPANNAMLGWYDMRARIKDSDDDYGGYYYKNNSFEVKNCRPFVTMVQSDQSTVLRDTTLTMIITGYDPEDLNEDLVLEVEYATPDGTWHPMNDDLQFGSDQWSAAFTPAGDALLGDYAFRARLTDSAEAQGDWVQLNGTVEVLNNLPVITTALMDANVVFRTQSINVRVEGMDVEDEKVALQLLAQLSPHGKDAWDAKGIGTIEWSEAQGSWTVHVSPDAHFATGPHDIRLRLVDSDQGEGEWYVPVKQIDIQNGPPVIELEYPALVNEGELTTFDASRSKDPEGGSLAFVWEFGDGTVGEGPKTTHVYKTYGSYNLKLKARDIDGLEVTKEVPLKVNALPSGQVKGLQDTGFNNYNVKFDSSQVRDQDGGQMTYKWDFDLGTDSNGNGNPSDDVDSTDANPSFNYGKSGTYEYKLTIIDDKGATVEKTGTVTVSSISTFTLFLLAMIIMVVVIVAIVAVVLSRRKRKAVATALPPPVPQSAVTTRSLLDTDDL